MRHKFWIAAPLMATTLLAVAKLPEASDAAREKAAEAAVQAGWSAKVEAFELCQAQNRVAQRYRQEHPGAAGQNASTPPQPLPACVDPGPFAGKEPGPKRLESAEAHSPATTATAPPVTAERRDPVSAGADVPMGNSGKASAAQSASSPVTPDGAAPAAASAPPSSREPAAAAAPAPATTPKDAASTAPAPNSEPGNKAEPGKSFAVSPGPSAPPASAAAPEGTAQNDGARAPANASPAATGSADRNPSTAPAPAPGAEPNDKAEAGKGFVISPGASNAPALAARAVRADTVGSSSGAPGATAAGGAEPAAARAGDTAAKP